jgi:outer membrane receptor protein involved in Fe transport
MMRLSMGWLVRFGLGLALAVGLGSQPVLAQSTSARIEGQVTDESGGAMPGSTVTATHVATNVSRSAVTDADGNYVLTALPLGVTKVTAELTGFAPQAVSATLNVNQVARIDFKLGVGAMTETVEVTGTAPVIEKSTSFIGTVIDRQQVEDLPLNGRNFTQLTTLSPGVTRGTPGSAANSASNAETFRYGEFGGTAISVNGLREQFNTYMLDGIDNNESLVNGIAYVPSPDVIEEFRLITTNAPAEFGRAGGAIQNIVSKSGTNRFSGAAYYYVRPKGLASSPKFAEEKPDFKNQDFGATLGGPIVKDQTFFFLSYHGLNSTIPVEAGNRVTVPTARMRTGDFSELLNPNLTGLQPITIYDPQTGLPFPGNIIPADRINPTGRNYLNEFPAPTEQGVLRNYLTAREKDTTFHDFDGRLDHNFGANDTGFVRASYWNDKFEDPGRIPGYQAGFGAGTSRNKGFVIGLGETHTFSPNVVNELRVGYIDFQYEFLPVGFGENQNEALGIGGPGGINLDNGISLIGGGDGRYIEYLGDFGQYQIEQKTLQLSDSVTWLRGNHAFKAGGTLLQRRMFQTRTQVGKGFYFYSDFVATPGNVPPLGQTGYEVSDMLIGVTNFTATGNPGYVPREVVHWENSLFVQDDWRVNEKLTLNLGLRYDVFTPYYEKDDQLANYDPETESLVLPGQNGVPRSTVDTDWNNLGPRLGFAYTLNEQTVVRGSYGIFYTLDRGGIDNQLTEAPPSVVTEYRFGGVPGAQVRLSDPIPLPTPVDPNSPELPQGSGVVYIPQDTDTTSVQQWSISGQRELSNRTALMVAYVGTRGENLTAKLTSAGFAGNIADRLSTLKNIGRSQYDGLQTSLRRTSADLSFLVSYTLSWSKDNVPSLYPGSASRGAAVTDPDDLDLDWGYADHDARHRLSVAGTWRLPLPQDNAFLSNWTLNTVYTLQTGSPFTAYASGGGPLRVNQTGDPNYPETEGDGYVLWVDRSAFSAPPAGVQQGTAERNSVRGPGVRTWDLSVFKKIALKGTKALELRFEGFNVLNTPQYAFPNQSFDDPNFGRITQTRLNTERQVQVAARFTF